MKDIELQAERAAFEAWWDKDEGIDNAGPWTPDSPIQFAWAAWRAAIEADRDKRVPDGAISGALFDFAGFLTTLDAPVRFGSTEEAAPMVELLQEFAKKRGLSLDDADVMRWSAMLASTPAPAQQEPAPMSQPNRLIAYSATAKLRELGYLWDEALESWVAQHQEQPQQERGPMTDEKDRALCEAHCNAAADEYFKARPQLDSDVNRRIFYAGHRKAWLEWQAAHGIRKD